MSVITRCTLTPWPAKNFKRSLEEGNSGQTLLVGEHLCVSQAAVIVDRHVHELPTGQRDRFAAATRRSLSPTIARNAMAGFKDAPELLDVDVDQLAGDRALVVGGSRRTRARALAQPTRFRTAETVESAICAPLRSERQSSASAVAGYLGDNSGGVLCGMRSVPRSGRSAPAHPRRADEPTDAVPASGDAAASPPPSPTNQLTHKDRPTTACSSDSPSVRVQSSRFSLDCWR